MSGHCIESEDFTIVVDKWDGSFLRRPGCKPHYFFLSHLHADHIKGLTSTWSRIIYTSPFNAWLLPMRRNVKPMLLKDIELNVTHTIRKSNNEIAFQVTLLDANHCPGAVMLLFQGKFGNILYTGDFRYTPRMLDYPVLSSIIRNKELNVLYLDNTYAAASCKFPSREDALKDVLKIVDENPDCKILIGMRQLGKEEVLRAIALHVNEKVCVSVQRLQILSKLEYEDVFTTDAAASRIHAVELHTITQRHSQEASKVVSIKLTSMYECGSLDKQRGNIYIVPYSDHSSHTELLEFVNQVRPMKLYPVVLPKIPKVRGETGPYYRMSTVNCVIPEEILQLSGPAAECGASSSDLNSVTINGSTLPIKFHPAPKVDNVEKMPNSVYIDEGMNLLPFDSLNSHLTNNNKARKHIKASWTRLAPKILSTKGIKFTDSSPEKSDLNQDVLSKSNDLDSCSSKVLGVKTKESEAPKVPGAKKSFANEKSDFVFDVPLSDDDELDMPSSARELGLRMLQPTTRPAVNGTVGVDQKSESSTDIIEESAPVMRRTRSKEKFEIPARPVIRNDSDSVISDLSSSVRTTRSKSSVSSTPVTGRPRTRLSLESLVDVAEDRATQQIPSRKSVKESPNSKGMSTRSSSSPNGLSRKSISLENLSSKLTHHQYTSTKTVSASKEDVASIPEKKETSSKKLQKKRSTSEKVEVVVLEDSEAVKNTPVRTNDKDVTDLEKRSSILETDSGTMDCSPVDRTIPEIPDIDAVKKKLNVNGSLSLSNFNGIHINSPGRKRLPLTCDWNAAQEIQRKETEQALKALESLNDMKGFKTRNLGNRSGLVALRRLSADNIPSKSPVKIQSLVVLPVLPTGLRPRTTSILSSMANNFSKSSSTKLNVAGSSPSEISDSKQTTTLVSSSSAEQNAISGKSATMKQTVSPLSPSTADKSSSSIISSSQKPVTTTSASTSKQSNPTTLSPGNIAPITRASSSKQVATQSASTSKQSAPPGSLKAGVSNRPETRSSLPVSSKLASMELSPIGPGKQSKKTSGSAVKEISPIAPVKESKRTSISATKEPKPIAPPTESKKTSPRRGKKDIVVVKSEDLNNESLLKKPTLIATKEVSQSLKGCRTRSGEPITESTSADSNQRGEDVAICDPATLRSQDVDVSKNSDSQEKLADELTMPKLEPYSPNRVKVDSDKTSQGQATVSDNSQKSVDSLNQGLFLTDDNLASAATSKKSVPKSARRSHYKKQNDLNVDLMRLKVGFAITQKGPKRLSLPSRLHSMRSDASSRSDSPLFQSKQKVQDWKKKISLHLRKSPQRRYRFKSPSKLRENAKRTLATILRSGRSLLNSQGYHGDVEDCSYSNQTIRKRSVAAGENSGYAADIESCSPPEIELCGELTQSSQSTSLASLPGTLSPSVIGDSNASEDSKLAVQSELRRSSRLVKEDGTESSNPTGLSKLSVTNKLKEDRNSNSSKNINIDLNPVSRQVIGISPILKSTTPSDNSAEDLSPARFSDRLSERSRMIFRKSADSVLAPKSSNILSLMADAFKTSLPLQTPTTANILSSMAENFKKLDEGAQVSPSLSIQLISSKAKSILAKSKNPTDWGVQITRVDSASSRSSSSGLSSFEGLPINAIPKSLSIEIIPESSGKELVQRIGPSPPTVTISPEVIDLSSDCPEEPTQSSIHSLPVLPGPRRLCQGGTRWPPTLKPEVQSPPQAVWKEKRRSSQSGDKVIIDIQTQEDPQKVAHCPVHCTCGAVSRQGTCMGTMRHLIDVDADCLYEVPLSPEDFEDSGAMLALGRGWIETCFDDVQDMEEFMSSYEDILPTLADSTKSGKSKSVSNNLSVGQRPSQAHGRQVLSSSKPSTSSLKQTMPVTKQINASSKKQIAAAPDALKKATISASSSGAKKQTEDKISSSRKPITTISKQTVYVSKAAVQGLPQAGKLKEAPKKRSSTDTVTSKASSVSSKDSNKKTKANLNERPNRPSIGENIPSRRSSSQSNSSSSSVAKSKSSKRSLSPTSLPPPLPPPKRRTLGSVVKSEVEKAKEDTGLKKKKTNSPTSSDSPETKKARCSELERLTDMKKGNVNKRYRLTVRRSLDHLMTRQKLRSDRRVKASSSSRS